MAWLGVDTAVLVLVFYVVVISLAEQVRIVIVLRITDSMYHYAGCFDW